MIPAAPAIPSCWSVAACSAQPNGLCFSPDERLLYVNDPETAQIRVFDVAPDGRLSSGRLFAENIRHDQMPGWPDGMKCDAQGNVWVTAPGGLWVYAPDGRHIGIVDIPEMTANLTWGGEDWRTLFICATHSVYTVQTQVGPRNEPYMRAEPARASRSTSSPTSATAPPATSESAPSQSPAALPALDPARTALIIQDMQNDVVMGGGAFASSGSPEHCRSKTTSPTSPAWPMRVAPVASR